MNLKRSLKNHVKLRALKKKPRQLKNPANSTSKRKRVSTAPSRKKSKARIKPLSETERRLGIV